MLLPLEIPVGDGLFFLQRGDITDQKTDAIVNAANPSLQGGGGVDGAIHRRGGPRILEECRRIRESQGECPPGEAVITSGGDLPARYVIHTVGPIWRGGDHGEEETLRRCYRNSLALAVRRGLGGVSFPSISTGAYGYPVDLAAGIALYEVVQLMRSCRSLSRVGFVLFDENTFLGYRAALSSCLQDIFPNLS